jgi:GNAT superfamily N-acetyltransferase
MAYRLSGSPGPLPPGLTRAQANRARLKALVDAGNPPGLIGYRGEVPVGWVSIGPREEYARLERSPVMKAVDGKAVWSVVCFVVPAEHRGQGVARALLEGAVAYARGRGATLVEAYPVDKPTRSNDDTMWFGAKSMYDKAGFKEVARRKPHRPVVRRSIGRDATGGSTSRTPAQTPKEGAAKGAMVKAAKPRRAVAEPGGETPC